MKPTPYSMLIGAALLGAAVPALAMSMPMDPAMPMPATSAPAMPTHDAPMHGMAAPAATASASQHGGGMAMPMPDAAPESPPRSAWDHADGTTLRSGPYILPGLQPPRLADQEAFGAVLIDRFELAHSNRGGDSRALDAQAWYGGDIDRVWLKLEAQLAQGRLQDARTELLWDRPVAAFWDLQGGLRHDQGGGPERNWLAIGVQGLAPYWFDVEVTAYLGEQGRSALRLNTSYALLLTQRWLLQPQLELNLYGRDDAARGVGSGLSDATAGLRLRYVISHQFEPYVGLEWSGRFGRSAELARATGEATANTAWVAGVHLWF